MRRPLLDLDRRLLLAMRTCAHPPWAEQLAVGGSRLGEHGACWLALGLAGAATDPPRRAGWLQGVRITGAAVGVNYAVKLVFRRPRPELPGLPPLTGVVSGLSLPSAHATTSFAAARAYRGLAPGWGLYGAATLLALSRPYLGVHYPSDVLAGALLGTAVGSWR